MGPAAETGEDPMTRITKIAKCFAVTAALVVAAVAGTSSADAGTIAATAGQPAGPGGFAAGPGCSVSCITSAVVTPTASSASVKVTTSAPTSTTVSVRRLDAQLGLAVGPQPTDIVLPAFAMTRTVLFPGLAPETSYRISVTARDMSGKKETRTGTFKTLAVKVAVDLPDLDLSAGLGCKADCIERGTVKAHPSRGRSRRLRHPPDREGSGSGRPLHLERQGGPQARALDRLAERHAELEAGRQGPAHRYEVHGSLKATDEQGRSRVEWGSFRTAKARALVTFHSIKVLDDGETGRGRDLLRVRASRTIVVGGNGFHKLSSGDSFTPRAVRLGSTEGQHRDVSIDGHRKLDVVGAAASSATAV